MEKVLPKGWVNFNISLLTSYNGLFSDGDWVESKDQDPNGEVRLIQLADIGENEFKDKSNRFLNQEKADELKCTFLKKNDVLIARMPDPIGRSCIFPLSGKYATVVDIAIVRFDPKFFNPFLFSYLVNSPQIRKQISFLASGSTRQRISRKNLDKISFPLPPLPEQERIVAKLDKLFAQHEKIKKALDRIPQLLKYFRQKVLTQAVTGEKIPLKDVGVWKGGGTPSKSNKVFWKNGDILWITSKDMKGMFLDDSIDKITLEGVEGSSANLIPKNSILIVTRSGILRRILPVSTNVKETTVNQDLKALIPYNGFNYKYLLYALNGKEEEIRNLCMKSGTTVESVEFDLLKNYMLQVPPLQEQQETVRRVECLFAKADAIEARYQILKAKIDNLPQAILHKAFKGELVPQLPTDGDAKDLLAEILTLKEEVKGRKKK